MYVTVNGARLFFDVEGAEYVADGPRLRRRPVVVLLHGGPGADHTLFKPTFATLTDVAQVIYLDHRGNGRSGGDDPAGWTLAQWGDDVKGFCDALGVERPIILGVSFGGFVAQAYATRHPDHFDKLILVSTAARCDFDAIYAAFTRIGGEDAGAAARAYWSNPTAESRAAYFKICLPLYTRGALDPDLFARVMLRNDVAFHFNGPMNEQGRMDFLADLRRIERPVMILAGEDDPITPIERSEEIAAAIPHAAFHRFSRCGHGVTTDRPDAAFAAIRAFIADTG